MGSGVLRAVGDTKRPLYFLILTSVLNIFLDLLFVLVFHWGIAGVAYATIIAQFISAGATLAVLLRTRDVYRFSFRDCVWTGTSWGRFSGWACLRPSRASSPLFPTFSSSPTSTFSGPR